MDRVLSSPDVPKMDIYRVADRYKCYYVYLNLYHKDEDYCS